MSKDLSPVLELANNDFKGSLSYPEYRNQITSLLTKNQVTGHTQSNDYLEYTKLNETRMNRWEKHTKLNPDLIAKISELDSPQTWLIITEGWCGDGAQNLPVFHLLEQASKGKLKLRILLRDDNPSIMDLFLTGTSRSIPVVVAFDQHMQLLWKWGPRPKAAQEIILQGKAQGEDTHKTKEALHLWYARNGQVDLQNELLELVSCSFIGNS
jgi:hypothetical protein